MFCSIIAFILYFISRIAFSRSWGMLCMGPSHLPSINQPVSTFINLSFESTDWIKIVTRLRNLSIYKS
jgi:hypothetical protein